MFLFLLVTFIPSTHCSNSLNKTDLIKQNKAKAWRNKVRTCTLRAQSETEKHLTHAAKDLKPPTEAAAELPLL